MINRILKNPIYRKHRELLISLIDCAIVIFAYFCAFFIVSLNFRISAMAELTVFSLLKGLTLMLVIYMASFLLFRINRSMWKYTGPSEVMHIVTAVLCAMCCTVLFRPLVEIRTLEIRTIVVSGLFVILLMCCVRLSYRLLRSHIRCLLQMVFILDYGIKLANNVFSCVLNSQKLVWSALIVNQTEKSAHISLLNHFYICTSFHLCAFSTTATIETSKPEIVLSR